MMFSPRDVSNFVEWGSIPCRTKDDDGIFPSPKTHVAVYWGRMLPLTAEHRQLATGKLPAFRGEKPGQWWTWRAPNRYSATNSLLRWVLFSRLLIQPYRPLRFALQKDYRGSDGGLQGNTITLRQTGIQHNADRSILGKIKTLVR